jgi:hypothetical protein
MATVGPLVIGMHDKIGVFLTTFSFQEELGSI